MFARFKSKIWKYTPLYIIDICTVKELQYLKGVVENDYREDDGELNYMVKGLNSNIDEIVHVDQLPACVITTLLPFKDDIIFDSVIGTSQMVLGSNVALKIFEDSNAQPKVYTLPNERDGNWSRL